MKRHTNQNWHQKLTNFKNQKKETVYLGNNTATSCIQDPLKKVSNYNS